MCLEITRRGAWRFGWFWIAVVISFAPAFAQSSFGEGTLTFRSAEHSKSDGLDVSVKYPATWDAREGERPHIVQKFVSPTGDLICTLLIIGAGQDFSPREVEEAVTPSSMKEMAPAGSNVVSASTTKLDALPAGQVIFDMRAEQAGISVSMRQVMFMTAYGRHVVQVGCSAAALASGEAVDKFQKNDPLFRQFANSLVIHNRWNDAVSPEGAQPSAVPTVPGKTLAEGPLNMSALDLLGSFFFTWIVGLSPALIARYAIFKQPVPKKRATWIAAVSCVVFGIIGFALNAASGVENPRFSPAWILVFFVSRWLMTRHPKQQSSDT